MYEREVKGNIERFFHSHSDDDLGLHALVCRVYTPVSVSNKGLSRENRSNLGGWAEREGQMSSSQSRDLLREGKEGSGPEPSDAARV